MTETRNDILARIREAENPSVIGLGAIGSWVARWLTANGISFRGFDPDTIAYKNLAAGAFRRNQVGLYKAMAFGGVGNSYNWDADSHTVGTAALVCADHGPTRRAAAFKAAAGYSVPFLCAKANGSLWQVWHVPPGSSPDDFVAFDIAAELDPVTVPCGDPSVGRVASLGAAAEMLSLWTGLDITPEEVEASFDTDYDPAVGHVLSAGWNNSRAKAEQEAQKAAEEAYKKAIDKLREESDSEAILYLNQLRRTRAGYHRNNRSTMHQRAIVELDRGETLDNAAKLAASSFRKVARPLNPLARVESTIAAQLAASELSIPDTVQIVEMTA